MFTINIGGGGSVGDYDDIGGDRNAIVMVMVLVETLVWY